MKPAAKLLIACVAFLPAALGAQVRSGWISVMNDRYPMVAGSGRVIQQARPVSEFRGVDLMGASNLHVTFGPRSSLMVRADDNVLPLLTTEVVGGVLRIGSRGSYRTRVSPEFYVTVPDLQSANTSGSGSIYLNDVRNRRLDLVVRGSGNARATGRTGALTVRVQGSGNAELRNLDAQDADVAVNGSGTAWVRIKGSLAARSNGSGSVFVLGRPARLTVHEGGSGRVIVRN